MGFVHEPHYYKVDANDTHFINMIIKYNKHCRILGFGDANNIMSNGNLTYMDIDLPGNPWTCNNLYQFMGWLKANNHPSTVIVFNMPSPNVTGFLPALPVSRVSVPASYKKSINAITDFINTIQCELSNTIHHEWTQNQMNVNIPSEDIDIDPNLLFLAFNALYPVSGAIQLKLENCVKILFEIQGELFVLTHSKTGLQINFQQHFYLDLDNGFCHGDKAIMKALNAQYFAPFKANHYQGELIPAAQHGFTIQPDKLYALGRLDKQIGKLHLQTEAMKEDGNPANNEAIAASFDLMTALRKHKNAFLDTPIENTNFDFDSDSLSLSEADIDTNTAITYDLPKLQRDCLENIRQAKAMMAKYASYSLSRFFDDLITAVIGVITLGLSLAIMYNATGSVGLGFFNRENALERRLTKMANAFTDIPEEPVVFETPSL